jgi:hypothetical protein
VTAGVNATTAGVTGTSEFAQPMFYMVEEPFIDGDFSDWPFAPVVMSPDSPDNFYGGEIDNPSDFSWQGALATDSMYLYYRAEATDDILVNVNEDNVGSLWQGDCIEWYLGMYDIRPSEPRHPESQFGNESDPSAAEPDWQMNIAGNAFDNPMRSQLYDAGMAGDLLSALGTFGLEVQGVETADGWAIEARIPWSGFVLDPAVVAEFVPAPGTIMIANMAGNDGDDPAGGRQGQLFWAKDEAANNSWNTPAAWQKEMVMYDPKVFGLGMGGTAVESTTWGQIKADVSQ